MPEHVPRAVAWSLTYLLAYTSGGAIVPFLFATRSVRIHATATRVRLRGADPAPMAALGFVVWTLPAILSVWGANLALLGIVASLVAWLGCRVRVDVTPARTRVIRTVLFFVPWSWRSYRKPPSAFTDGWGDFSDPLALYLELGDGATIELGWQGTGSPSCDHLARELNEGIAALGPPRGASPKPHTTS
ncbi:MAG: hypothetical protein IPK71_01705 [Myxococcales bacterium]|nr:hypothetical protein [Myxococcales bacterium]